MSRRAWVFVAALGLILLAGLSIDGWRDWNDYLSYKVEHAGERQVAANNDASNAQSADQPCWPSAREQGFSGWLVCLIQHVSAAQNAQQSKNDLKAQQDMAEWSYGSMLWTKWTFILSILGVSGVLVAIGQTRVALRHAAETNDLTREERRPWVTFSFERAYNAKFSENGITMTVTITIENLGKYPAIDVEMHHEPVQCGIYRSADELLLEYSNKYVSRKHRPFRGSIYYPGQQDQKTITFWIPFDHLSIKNGILIFAVTYRDPSGSADVFSTVERIYMSRAVNDPKNELRFDFSSPFRHMLIT